MSCEKRESSIRTRDLGNTQVREQKGYEAVVMYDDTGV